MPFLITLSSVYCFSTKLPCLLPRSSGSGNRGANEKSDGEFEVCCVCRYYMKHLVLTAIVKRQNLKLRKTPSADGDVFLPHRSQNTNIEGNQSRSIPYQQ